MKLSRVRKVIHWEKLGTLFATVLLSFGLVVSGCSSDDVESTPVSRSATPEQHQAEDPFSEDSVIEGYHVGETLKLTASLGGAGRAEGARRLGEMGEHQKIKDTLLKLTEDADPIVRAETATALGKKQANESIIKTLIHMSKDSDYRVRVAVASALVAQPHKSDDINDNFAKIDHHSVVNALLGLVSDPYMEPAIAALEALGETLRASHRVVAQSALESSLEDPLVEIRLAALRGLSRVSKDQDTDESVLGIMMAVSAGSSATTEEMEVVAVGYLGREHHHQPTVVVHLAGLVTDHRFNSGAEKRLALIEALNSVPTDSPAADKVLIGLDYLTLSNHPQEIRMKASRAIENFHVRWAAAQGSVEDQKDIRPSQAY